MNQEERMKKYMEDVFDSKKPYAFISYSHDQADVEKVYTLLDELMKRGINFAIDTEYASKVGNWMNKMNHRLSSSECKCMLSFYSKSYVYSRPSLLEQLLRYSEQVTSSTTVKERKKTYSEEMKKELTLTNMMPSIVISLFGSKGIKKQIENKDEEQLEKIRKSKSDWELEPGSDIYNYFLVGLSGYFTSPITVKDAMYNLGAADKLDFIRKYFADILEKENQNNTNLHTEVKEIAAMLASFGVVEDADIKQKASVLFDMTGPATESFVTPEPVIAPPVTPEPVIPPMVATPVHPEPPVKPDLPVLPIPDHKEQIWTYKTQKGAFARLLWDGESKRCTVLTNSKTAYEAAGFASLPAAKKLKDDLIAEGVLVNDRFVRDYDCEKIATMINVLNGGSVSRNEEIQKGRLAPTGEASVQQPVKDTPDVPVQPTSNLSQDTSLPVGGQAQIKESPLIIPLYSNGAQTTAPTCEPERLESCTMSLAEFVRQYNNSNFKKNTFEQVRLKTADGSYVGEFWNSTRDMVWQFMMKLIKDNGETVMQQINMRCPGSNPIFIPANQMSKYKVSYSKTDVMPDWAMCTNYSQADWPRHLKKCAEAVGFRSENLQLEFQGFCA